MPPVDPDRLTAALMKRFTGDVASRLLARLRFFGRITGGVDRRA